jgi:hypothetical protein
MAREMDMVHKNGLVVRFMRDNGKKIELTAKASLCNQMVIFLKEILKTTKLVDTALTSIRMVQNMRDNGLTISSMDLELNFGKMALNMMETIATAVKMVLGATNGMTGQCSPVTGTKIRFMG